MTLSRDLVNAELIGSCAWGIPASIDIFKKTDISNYITVSTTHNLGFNHSSWAEFISLSEAAGLPVWDSELNHSKKFDDRATRLEAALEYGVDGLVLYNSWNSIDMTNCFISDGARDLMEMYLKPSALKANKMEEAKLFNHFSSSNTLTIQLVDGVQNCSLSLHDLSGRSVYSVSQCRSDRLVVDNLDKGVYLLSLQSGDVIQSEKVSVY